MSKAQFLALGMIPQKAGLEPEKPNWTLKLLPKHHHASSEILSLTNKLQKLESNQILLHVWVCMLVYFFLCKHCNMLYANHS